MSMTNHPIEQEELMAYLEDELPVDRAGAAAEHIEHCLECRGLAADLLSLAHVRAGCRGGPGVSQALE